MSSPPTMMITKRATIEMMRVSMGFSLNGPQGFAVNAPMPSVMEVSPASSAQLTAMAAGANDGLAVAMLQQGISLQAESLAGILQGLPQSDSKGQLVDVQA